MAFACKLTLLTGVQVARKGCGLQRNLLILEACLYRVKSLVSVRVHRFDCLGQLRLTHGSLWLSC
jgi:hypothetical protein